MEKRGAARLLRRLQAKRSQCRRADILVRSKPRRSARPGCFPGHPLVERCCGQECPRAGGCGIAALRVSAPLRFFFAAFLALIREIRVYFDSRRGS